METCEIWWAVRTGSEIKSAIALGDKKQFVQNCLSPDNFLPRDSEAVSASLIKGTSRRLYPSVALLVLNDKGRVALFWKSRSRLPTTQKLEPHSIGVEHSQRPSTHTACPVMRQSET